MSNVKYIHRVQSVGTVIAILVAGFLAPEITNGTQGKTPGEGAGEERMKYDSYCNIHGQDRKSVV